MLMYSILLDSWSDNFVLTIKTFQITVGPWKLIDLLKYYVLKSKLLQSITLNARK